MLTKYFEVTDTMMDISLTCDLFIGDDRAEVSLNVSSVPCHAIALP